MRHFGGLFWFVLVMATGIGNFAVKQTVQSLDDELANVRKKTVAEQKEIHELTADWTFLNQPELLADLNRRYVGLVPISPKQVVASIDAIPLRPVPPAASQEAAPQMAAAVAAAPAGVPAAIPATIPAAAPAPPPAHPTIVPVAAAAPARVPIVPVTAAAPARSASLDSLFAQVAGER
jgi:hypothetical protein